MLAIDKGPIKTVVMVKSILERETELVSVLFPAFLLQEVC